MSEQVESRAMQSTTTSSTTNRTAAKPADSTKTAVEVPGPVAPLRSSSFPPGSIVLGLVLALLVFAPPAAAQVVVDDFSVAQAAITEPPGVAASVVTGGAGIFGRRRDLAVTILTGVGAASAEVADGLLTFTVADTTPDSRGEVLLTWDADSSPGVLDSDGLRGIDLTTGGQGALRLTVDRAAAGVEVEIEVHTDADYRSRAARVLPAIVATIDVFFDFAELVPSPGAAGPADLTRVGALTLRVRATEGAMTASGLGTAPPQIAALQADFTDAGAPIGGGSVVPGEIFRYRVTINNTGGGAEGVELTNVLDPALIPGTFRTTPVARPDLYSGFGNVDLVVDGVALAALNANDTDADGDSTNVVAAVDLATVQGGEVDIAADGSFTYSPPAGFTGIDSFTYTVAPVVGDPSADASGNPVGPFTSTVTITLDRTVWFVDNSHGGPFEGTQSNPFATLAAAEAASGPGDIIRLRRGDGTTTGYDLGLGLQPGQHLIGGGVPLVIEGQTIEAADPGGRPQLTHTSGGPALELAADHVIHGVDVVSAEGGGISGSNVGSVEVRESAILNAGGPAIEIDGGSLDFELDSVSSHDSATYGVRLVAVTGSLTVFGTTTVLGFNPSGGNAIEIFDSPGLAVDFGATTVSITALAGLGGPTVPPGRVPGTPVPEGLEGVGVHLVGNPGASISFDSLSISAHSIGMIADDTGTININSSTTTITAGAPLELSNTAGLTNGVSGWTFQSLVSTGNGSGVYLSSLSDDFVVTGFINLPNAFGTAITVGNCPGLSFDFGSVTVVDDNVGGGTTANGINLLGNVGSSFSFDNLTLVTDGGFGLRVGPSTVNFGVGTFIAANGGAALDFANTTIGPGRGGSPATLVEATSVGSPEYGMRLFAVTGEIVINGGFIHNASGSAVRVRGGAPVITYHGEISHANAAPVVWVEDTLGGSVSFPGQTTGTAATMGVRLVGNAGNVSFDGLTLGTAVVPLTSTAVTLTGGSTGRTTFANTQIFTDGATGFFADDGGVVELTEVGNRVSTTNGTAVRMIGGTTIGPAGATFDSISASGGDNGIHLAGTGTAGVFTVLGNGTSAPNGSGGTIENTTGDGVLLSNAHGVVLRSLHLYDIGDSVDSSDGGNNLATNDHAIQSEDSSGITLSGVHVRQPAAGGWEAVNLGGVNRVDHRSLFEDINASNMQALEVRNTNTNLDSLTIDDVTFRDQPATNTSSYVIVSSHGSSTMSFTVTNNSLFENLFGHALQVNAGESVGSTGVVTTVIEDSRFQNAVAGTVGLDASGGIGGLVLAASDLARHNFTIRNNGFFELGRPLANGGVISVQALSGSGILAGDILDNDIDRIGFPDGSQTTSDVGHRVIDVVAEGSTPWVDVRIEGNTIDETSREAIVVSSREASGAGSGGGDEYFDVRIHDNDLGQTVAIGTTNREAIEILSEDISRMRIEVTDNTIRGNTSGLDEVVDIDVENTSTMDLTMTGNTVVNLQGAGGLEVTIDTENGTSSLCLDFRGNTAVEVELDVDGLFRVEDFASIAANNPGVGTFLDGAGVTGVATGTCDSPSFWVQAASPGLSLA